MTGKGPFAKIADQLAGRIEFMPERVEHFYKTARIGGAINLVLAVLIAGMLFSTAKLSSLALFVGAAACAIWIRHSIYRARVKNPDRFTPARWAQLMLMTGVLFGIVWGGLFLSGVMDDRPEIQILAFLVVTAGSISNIGLLSWLPMYLAYPTTASVMIGISMWRHPDPTYIYFSIVIFAAVPLLAVMALTLSPVVTDNFRLRARDREMLEKLRAEKERAEAATRAKSAFLATMSHEMRTPLNGVMGMLQILSRSIKDDAPRQQLLVARQASEALRAVIDDVLDFTKIESGAMTVESKAFDLPALLGEAATILKAQAAAKGLSLETKFDASLPRWVRSDPTRLRQALLNLLGNAVKFTDTGRIELSAGIRSPRGGPAEIAIAVSDSGIGIAPDKIDKLFRPFAQADDSITRRFGGTGLGLVISRRIAEALGGGITVRSTEGVGSVFELCLPLALADGTGEASARIPVRPERKLDVLVVDDQPINREVACELLALDGHRTKAAIDGATALAELARGGRFDVALLDLHMPDMTGFELAVRIRGHGDARLSALPLVALSAATAREDVARCREARMNGFVAKPIDEARLLEALARVTSGAEAFPDDLPAAEADAPVFDRAQAAEMIEAIGIARYRDMVEKFAVMAKGQAATIRTAAEAGDAPALAVAAHAMIGQSAQLGGRRLGAEARAIEQLAHASDTDEARQRSATLENLIAESLAAMRSLSA